jgi:hypothetical protein
VLLLVRLQLRQRLLLLDELGVCFGRFGLRTPSSPFNQCGLVPLLRCLCLFLRASTAATAACISSSVWR